MLVPPENFAMVEDGIFRCSKLDAINISFLKSLDLKSIAWINEEKPPRALRQFIQDHNIKLFHLMNSSVLPEEEEITNVKYQEWMVLKPSLISKTIEIILDIENQNCLLMDRSEIIIGILRHIQRWSYSSISNEYRLYASRTSYKVEIFLELINLELLPHHEDIKIVKYIENEEEISGLKSNDNAIIDDEDVDCSYDDVNNHSLSQAISIKGDSNTIYGNYNGVIASSPAVRRLSMEHRNEIKGLKSYNSNSNSNSNPNSTSSSPISSSVGGNLSISTSPQIPKNLLKMVEMRKNKKKQNYEQKEEQTQLNDFKIKDSKYISKDFPKLTTNALDTYEYNNNNKNTRKIFEKQSPIQTMLKTGDSISRRNRRRRSSQLGLGIEPSSTRDFGGDCITTNSNSISNNNTRNKHPNENNNEKRPNNYEWKLYKPKKNGIQVRRSGNMCNGSGNSRHERPVHTTIRVQLPRESCLPRWFIELRKLCEEQLT